MPKKLNKGAKKGAARVARVLAAIAAVVVYLVAPVSASGVSGRLTLAAVTLLSGLVAYGALTLALRTLGTAAINRTAK